MCSDESTFVEGAALLTEITQLGRLGFVSKATYNAIHVYGHDVWAHVWQRTLQMTSIPKDCRAAVINWWNQKLSSSVATLNTTIRIFASETWQKGCALGVIPEGPGPIIGATKCFATRATVQVIQHKIGVDYLLDLEHRFKEFQEQVRNNSNHILWLKDRVEDHSTYLQERICAKREDVERMKMQVRAIDTYLALAGETTTSSYVVRIRDRF